MTLARFGEIFGRGESAVRAWVRSGKINAEKQYFGNGNRFRWAIPREEVRKLNMQRDRKSEAWAIICDLWDDGTDQRTIGQLVNPSTDHPQQTGWNAINLGTIVDVDGFFKRLKESGL